MVERKYIFSLRSPEKARSHDAVVLGKTSKVARAACTDLWVRRRKSTLLSYAMECWQKCHAAQANPVQSLARLHRNADDNATLLAAARRQLSQWS